MIGLISGLKVSARRAVRAAAFSAAFGVVGLIFALAGLASLTAALWILIAMHKGAITAFVSIGAIYIIVGGVFLLLAARRPRPYHRHPGLHDHPYPPREPILQMAEAFAIGMQAGRAARRR